MRGDRRVAVLPSPVVHLQVVLVEGEGAEVDGLDAPDGGDDGQGERDLESSLASLKETGGYLEVELFMSFSNG